MSVFYNDAISPNEYDSTPPQDIYTVPHTPDQPGSTSDVSGPLQGPSHTSYANSPPE